MNENEKDANIFLCYYIIYDSRNQANKDLQKNFKTNTFIAPLKI